jgi:hypothetical protein
VRFSLPSRASRTRTVAAFATVAAAFALLPLRAGAQSLRGSPSSVNRMYRYAVRHDLHFYQTGPGVRNAVEKGKFVRLSGSDDYQTHDVSFPYVAPATKTFVERLASEYRDACDSPLIVTSAIRPDSRQPENASARSVHPTGIAVDLRKPQQGGCLTWLRGVLKNLEQRGVIEATEEHYPAHFHVAVFGAPYMSYVASITHGNGTRATRLANGQP